MPGAWLLADDIISLVDAEIALLGADAFQHGGHAHLYSGPGWKVRSEIADYKFSNQDYARILAKRRGAALIDDTAIGQFLGEFEGKGVYDYFENNPLLPPTQRFTEADKVWRHTSQKFIESLWGKVSTSVCGVDRTRIFYTEEIPTMAESIPALIGALVKTEDIETVNEIPIGEIRKRYTPANWAGAYRLICLGEQRQLLREATHSGSVEIMDAFLNSQERYQIDRSFHSAASVYRCDPMDRMLVKQRKLQEFMAAQLAALLPTTPSAHTGGTGHPRLVAGLHR